MPARSPACRPSNLACALAAAVALGFDARVTRRADRASVAPVANRLTVVDRAVRRAGGRRHLQLEPRRAPRAALELLRGLPVDGRRVVVTPGMVELGRRQRTENEAFAGAAARARGHAGRRRAHEPRGPAAGVRRTGAHRSSGWRPGARQSSGCAATLGPGGRRPLRERPARPLPLSRPRPRRRRRRDVGQVAVLFGGPAPEHDVSILTGLQATRELAAAGRDRRRDLLDQDRVRSSRSTRRSRRRRSSTGAPSRARAARRFGSAPRGASARPGDWAGTRRLEVDAVVLCTHGGPGEDGTLQGALDLAGIRYAGPTVAGCGDRHGQARLRRADGHRGVPGAPARRAHRRDRRRSSFDGPYIVKPRFGGSSIGIDVVERSRDREGATRGEPAPRRTARSSSRTARTSSTSRSRCAPTPCSSSLRSSARFGASDGAEILDYADKYVAGEGMARRAARAARGSRRRRRAARSGTPRPRRDGVPVRGVIARIDFLEGERRCSTSNEINTIPGSLSRYLFIDPKRHVPRAAGRARRRGDARCPRTATHGGRGRDRLRAAGAIASKLA